MTTLAEPTPPNTLEDVQGRADTRGIALQAAGVRQVQMPLSLLQKNGESQRVCATASLSVALLPEDKGTHMSRFIEQLSQWSDERTLSLQDLGDFLQEMQGRLKAPSAQMEVSFTYFINKKAPVSDGSAPMAYPCRYRAALDANGQLEAWLRIEAAMATLCPCSKSISDFGAHNQRAITTVDLYLDTTQAANLFPEDLALLVDQAASCPVFPLLKREDEKWVTERQYTNAKFVEDVVRDSALLLRELPAVSGFRVVCEALESIHGHNAWASYAQSFAPERF